MLIFNKVLPIFVLPIGAVILLLLYALLQKRRWPVGAALVLLFVASMPLTGSRLLRILESRYASVALAEVEAADAIVVLSGIWGPSTKPGHMPRINDSVERLEGGIQLMQLQKAPTLVFTGGLVPWGRERESEGERSRRAAIARGIQAERIVVAGMVGNTADEARVIAVQMRERNWKRVILVTTAWHMPRAARLFRKAGVDFKAFPVDFHTGEDSPLTVLDLLPTANGLEATEQAMREALGLLFYAATGR